MMIPGSIPVEESEHEGLSKLSSSSSEGERDGEGHQEERSGV
jgi:hypothetical protein